VNSDSEYHRRVTIYLLAACFTFALLSTIQSVPYYALGIELCPSYDGRTRVVVARAYVDKLMSFVAPWVMPFVFLPMFTTAVNGLVWYAVITCVIGIPTTVAMCMVIKERGYDPHAKRPPGPHLLRSIWLTAKNPHFLKILFLYVFIGFTNGVFGQALNFLVIFWVFKGDVVGGVMSGYGSMIAAALTFATLPAIKWACEKFGKHRALRWAIVWFAIGSILKWVPSQPRPSLALSDHPVLLLRGHRSRLHHPAQSHGRCDRHRRAQHRRPPRGNVRSRDGVSEQSPWLAPAHCGGHRASGLRF